jgi:hypothetical protein
LQDATTKLDRHEADFQARFPIAAREPEGQARSDQALTTRLNELPKKLAPLDALVATADAEASEIETALRDFGRRSESIRLRLAEGVGRAIG